ncbi:MAG: hypothetical protein CBB92_07155 [Flammeovirgaceae bacterium TMED32]|nr:MAG: hypothetical protein CBB92_07155 [Flammeovirgaceae bacterium TMED32]|tara:strand:- start:187 stop:648 length:462 start_codon:yes stop_codon:yes gene_type:complete
MLKEFEELREDEIDLMLSVPILVSVLIAGADGNIDHKEKKEAILLAYAKQHHVTKQLAGYYQLVGQNFEEKLLTCIAKTSDDLEIRNSDIIQELRKLNLILPKLDKHFAMKFYDSIEDWAKRIAEASGGILGYMSVTYEEAKLLTLKMIRSPQ